MDKLWIVHVEMEAFVLAETEGDALNFGREIISDYVEVCAEAEEFDGETYPLGWSEDDLVYRAARGDITAEAAIQMVYGDDSPKE